MAMRITGMYSGLDTESIIQELVSAKQVKVDTAKKEQTKLQWKQDAWKELNSKIYKLFNSTINNMRYQSTYAKKTTKVSNSNAVSIITGENAVNATQSLKITELARAGYLTGGKLTGTQEYTADTRLTASTEDGGLGLTAGSSISVTTGGKTTKISISENSTISSFLKDLNAAGVNASFDAKNQRFFISAASTGEENDFSITGLNAGGSNALDALGLSVNDDAAKDSYLWFVNNKDSVKAERIQMQLDTYTSRLKTLEDGEKTMKKQLTDTYAAYFDGVDTDDMDAVYERLADISADPQKYNLTNDDAAYTALANWKVDYEGIQREKTEILSKLDAQTGDDGTVTYSLNAEQQGIINDLVDDEAAYVQERLDNWSTVGAGTASNKIVGTDARIELNGVEFISSSNSIEVNGLTYTVNAVTAPGEEITVTTLDDTDGIYDMVRNFIKEYNALINEMDKLYNADSAKGYEPLTSEEKDALSDSEVEDWEKKIKDSLLRRDSTLNTVASAMKSIMASGFEVGGKTMYLSDFGIETLGYYSAAENERNAYHIAGDPDDASTSANADKLKGLIASDPEAVTDFFTALSRSLYEKLDDLMRGTEYSSTYSVYDDKKMQEEYDSYTTKIKELEEKLQDYEDKWYKKFSAMETALAKLQSNSSAVTSLLGGL